MSTHNIGFYEEILPLNYHQISSNTHLISSAATSMLRIIRAVLSTLMHSDSSRWRI